MAKSYRTAFLRVTAENETNQDGLVIYTKTDVYELLKDWSTTAGITYWFIEHAADEEVSKTHYHIVIKFRSPTPFETIKHRFPYGDIESARNLKASVQYLIHFNDRSKTQYSWDDIVTNCTDMTPYKVKTSSQQEITIMGIMESIDIGKIREYNQFTEIPIELWSKHKTRIENALTYYRERVCMDKNRSIEVIFISGNTGLGKTTFAKDYCDGLKKSYCVSSASNDPLQDYKGEDVLILDDLRDSEFRYQDMLKMLDNHTMSTAKSRYHNKAFIGDTIIITSTRPLNDWYYNKSSEDKHQLYRRIRQVLKFTSEKIEAFEYDDKLHRYVPAGTAPNYVAMKIRERARLAMKVFDAVGVEFTPADRKHIDDVINNSTDADLERFNVGAPATDEEKAKRAEYEKSLPPIDWEKVNKHRVG